MQPNIITLSLDKDSYRLNDIIFICVLLYKRHLPKQVMTVRNIWRNDLKSKIDSIFFQPIVKCFRWDFYICTWKKYGRWIIVGVNLCVCTKVFSHKKYKKKLLYMYLMPTASVLWGLRDSCTYLCKHTSDRNERNLLLWGQVSQKALKMP